MSNFRAWRFKYEGGPWLTTTEESVVKALFGLKNVTVESLIPFADPVNIREKIKATITPIDEYLDDEDLDIIVMAAFKHASEL